MSTNPTGFPLPFNAFAGGSRLTRGGSPDDDFSLEELLNNLERWVMIRGVVNTPADLPSDAEDGWIMAVRETTGPGTPPGAYIFNGDTSVWMNLLSTGLPANHASTHITGVDKVGATVPANDAIPQTPSAPAAPVIDDWVTADAVAGTPSRRRLGTGATDACAGDDVRLLIDPSSSKTFYVDMGRTETYTQTGSQNRPFKTIQAAINAVIARGDSSQSNPYTIRIAPGVYPENLVLEDSHLVSLIMIGEGSRLQTQINPAAGLALRCNANNANFYDLHMENIQFTKPTEMVGAANGNYFGFNFFFDNCYWATTASALFRNMTYPSFNGDWTKFGGGLTISNITQFSINDIGGFKTGAAFNIIETNEAANMPYGFGTLKGTSVLCTATRTPDFTWSLLNIVTMNGTALQLRAVRGGSSGFTIPANAQIIAYYSALIGSYVVDVGGKLDLYNSWVSGTLSGGGTISVYQKAEHLKYTPLVGANWVDPDPIDVKAALDRMAAAIVAHTGAPIP